MSSTYKNSNNFSATPVMVGGIDEDYDYSATEQRQQQLQQQQIFRQQPRQQQQQQQQQQQRQHQRQHQYQPQHQQPVNPYARPSFPPPPPPHAVMDPETTLTNYNDDDEEEEDDDNANDGAPSGGDDALLDLAQLEELHQEAERMKALGNKHMAAQQYARAYNAYSAALQLSPVGPSSHVFLSNRAAALLSLKKYGAAAQDARRAVALAPTFGKAHARLGQALYFVKDYAGAVSAYEEAVRYEPDNVVTKTYLTKAQTKLAKQQAREESNSMADETTFVNSIATDPHGRAAVVKNGFLGSSQQQLVRAVGPPPSFQEQQQQQQEEQQDDPDFDEAVRIQVRANQFLTKKQYKSAIEEYSAALFLVPDDPYLSPELHLGRAHALNGSRRHDSAKNDAKLAIKLRPTPEAYSTLAKCHFYLRDYDAAIEAFEDCEHLLPEGDTLSTFDQAYLEKAKVFQREQLENRTNSKPLAKSPKGTVPRLPPPRFVPREQAIQSTPNMPSMPKNWPQQTPRTSTALVVGQERPVTFLSESLGIKLNRGADGIVRVMSVTPDAPASPIARQGTIQVGDIVREAAGVDVRRPITNIMWGDTVALIKMAPRPITLVVAKELSEIPIFVLEERERIKNENERMAAAGGIARG